jgi:SatD family (SatD)
MDNYWIIMADVIDSGGKDAVLLQNQLKECVEITNKKYQKSVLSPLTITLGDEFQGVAKSLKNCIEIVISIEELIVNKSFDFQLRFVIYYGKIDTPINTEIAYSMLGEGLTKARDLTNNLKNAGHRFYFEVGKSQKNLALNSAFEVFENIVEKWKNTDDKMMASQFIKYIDYKIIAEKLSKPRSQIWKRKNSLEINSYFAIKNVINYIV